jgi:glyoxylase-like metal-dependent hydrolase (beta-lactamase superfamily II)
MVRAGGRVVHVNDTDWFEVQRFADGITMIREPHHDEDVKSYLIEGNQNVAVLDTGLGVGDFPGLVRSLSDRGPVVLQTHAHWDHIGASHQFDDVRVHPAEAALLQAGCSPERYSAAFAPGEVDEGFLPDGFTANGGLPGREPTGWLEHGERIDLGGRELKVYHTPGHSPGGLTFLDRSARALFVADLLYHGRMYVFLPTSDASDFRASLRLAAALEDEVDVVYPAHGPSPLSPGDVREIRDAFESVWTGQIAATPGSLFGIATANFDFGHFSFLLPADFSPPSVAG